MCERERERGGGGGGGWRKRLREGEREIIEIVGERHVNYTIILITKINT